MIEVVALVAACKFAGWINDGSFQQKCSYKDIHLSFAAESVTPQQCMMYGQMELAKWTEGNPNWKIRKFSCGRSGRYVNL